MDTPCLRIKFDNTIIIPKFHGPRTLICKTPRHDPSVVQIRVSNDNGTFSKSDAKFTYRREKDHTPGDKIEHQQGGSETNFIDSNYENDTLRSHDTFDPNFFSDDWEQFIDPSSSRQNFNNNNFSLKMHV